MNYCYAAGCKKPKRENCVLCEEHYQALPQSLRAVVKNRPHTTETKAWIAFCGEMAGRQYGEEEEREAWLWFLGGWLSRGH
jgi:methylphosphotriester-DNA--protein-cysteine methyltransferase